MPESIVKRDKIPDGDPIEITFYDLDPIPVNVTDCKPSPLFTWLASIHDTVEKNGQPPSEEQIKEMAKEKAMTGILTVWDGTGLPVKRWHLHEIWPTTLTFGEGWADENISVVVTVRYAKYEEVPIETS